MTGFAVGAFSVGIVIVGAGAVCAQNFPTKAIRIVTSPPGGGVDFASRVIAQSMTVNSGVQAIVDNRPGGVIQGEILVAAPADGYTLLLAGPSLWLAPFMRDNVPYDPVKDFSPVSLVAISSSVLVAHPSLPVNSVKELIALAKARPGEINYGSGAAGSPSHLAAELLRSMAGIKIVRINYKGIGPTLTALLAGEVQLSFTSAASVAPYMKSGRLRALAVTGAEPSALAPGLPTVAAAGLPGYETTGIFAVFAPAKTPPVLINRLNQEIARVLDRTDVKQKFLNSGIEAAASSPEQLAATVKTEMGKWGKIIRDAGIREQ